MKRILLIALVLLVSMSIFSRKTGSQMELISGHIYYSKISGVQPTQRWEGIIGNVLSGEADETNKPIGSMELNSANEILVSYFVGSNFLDGKHYFAALPANVTFNLTKLENVTEQDLESNGIFNQTNFPIFFPNYYEYSDNPKNTFCCENSTIVIGGVNFKAFVIQLQSNVPYYLLKYRVNSTTTLPMFFVPLGYYTGYNGSSCNYELILPIGKTYYFYVLSKEPPVKLDVWIDGQHTTHFSQTALTYNLTLRATNLYTGAPTPNESVAVLEENGNNIFVPRHLSGEIGRGISLAQTDDEGYAQFIVAPTEYPTSHDYSIAVAIPAYEGSKILKRINLTVDNSGALVKEVKQPTSVPGLLDNIKATVNTMNPIINSLYKWANIEKKAWMYKIIFYTNGSYKIENLTDYSFYNSATLKTGAPNVLVVEIKNPDGTTATDDYAVINEKNGYLLFNPTLDASQITPKTRIDKLFEIKNGDQVIVAPTSYSDAHSTVYMSFYTPTGALLGNITFNIDRTLSYSGGSYFENDLLKTQINSMNQVAYSLYWSLNH